MVAVMLMSVVLIAGLCVLAYTFAVYALPFMLSATAAQFAYHTGASLVGFGLVAAVAGYALLYGVTKESVPPEIWWQILCIVGASALLR